MPSNESGLGSLVEWFLGRAGDRRQYKRRKGAFHLWWRPAESGEGRPGIGLELSPSGLVFIIRDTIATAEFNLILRIEGAKLPVRVRKLRSDQVVHDQKPWNRYMGEFVGIAADDWDRLVRYVNEEPELADRRKMQNQEMSNQTDDAYRLLPLNIQQKIVQILVQSHRLNAPPAGQTPLLKMFYSGLVQRPGKAPAHRINVHSRVTVNDELVAYDTRFVVADDGEVALV